MPIMATQAKTDARLAARLLASLANDCVRRPETGPGQAVGLNNVFRLLEAFRANSYFGVERPAKLTSESERLSLILPRDRHVKEVRSAIEDALEAAFTGEPTARAIETVYSVLRAITYPGQFDDPTVPDLQRTRAFFERMLENLRAA